MTSQLAVLLVGPVEKLAKSRISLISPGMIEWGAN